MSEILVVIDKGGERQDIAKLVFGDVEALDEWLAKQPRAKVVSIEPYYFEKK
jgi:hypothetical protein